MESQLIFSSLEDSFGGYLQPEDIRMFYYDICFDKETEYSKIYTWGQEVEEYRKNNHVKIEGVDDLKKLPATVKDNEVYFGMIEEDEQNMAAAYFRHLRNSFSHFSIGYNGNYLCMKDYLSDGKTLSMIGKIDRDIFLGLMQIFFEQKRAVEEHYYHHLNPEV